jgi:DNA-3-methyladenine glycosylase
MFEAGGIVYVYLIYGMHHCLNIVSGDKGYPAAILLRAAESPDGAGSASGPGRLSRAFRVDRSMDGASLLGPDLWLELGSPVGDREVGRTARIGVGAAGSWSRRRFRFLIRKHPDVSGPRALNRRAR